jgi:hypothetical protein
MLKAKRQHDLRARVVLHLRPELLDRCQEATAVYVKSGGGHIATLNDFVEQALREALVRFDQVRNAALDEAAPPPQLRLV